jgi:hypothetical protein
VFGAHHASMSRTGGTTLLPQSSMQRISFSCASGTGAVFQIEA